MNTTRSGAEQLARQHLEESSSVTRRAAAECAGPLAAAAALTVAALQAGGKLLLCGNGGSASDAQHLAAEFVGVLDRARPRTALAALALTTNGSLVTAVANDVGFERVFERQVEALGRRGDVLLALSTGGNSPNILNALQRARDVGLTTILLTGDAGGRGASLADVLIAVPSANTQHIQETHIALGHALVSLVEMAL
jgi:D-sedoheptulose 7-phosphate isomerase